MGVLLIWLVTLLLVLDLSSAATAAAKSVVCDRCVHQSNATFFPKDDAAVPNGACGYGNQAKKLYGGHFAGAKPVIYKKGVDCGACFQVRCQDEINCKEAGTTIIVTDVSNNEKNRTGFVMSQIAFKAMAKNIAKSIDHLMKLGHVDVEYQRVPCEYGKKNMSIRVEESSKKEKGYLAILLLYQGGQADILSIDLALANETSRGSENWVSLTRTNNGAVWDISGVPEGALKFQFKVGARDSWVWYTTKPVLPANWTNGAVYDSGIQITDKDATPPETCKTCSNVWT